MTDGSMPAALARPSPHLVELLFASRPSIDAAAIAARVAERAGAHTDLAPRDRGDGVGIVFPEHEVPFVEGMVPLAVWLLPVGDRSSDDGWVEKPLHQTWSWPSAELVVRRTTTALLVTDLMAGTLDRRIRLRLFNAVVGAAIDALAPDALHALVGGRFVSPESFVRDLADDPLAFESTVNVRYVTISDRPGEQLMDTLGMAPFGLPDIQMHYTTLDPAWVSGKIHGVARYLFDQGDIIKDRQTVPGLDGNERWPCAHEIALMGPEREVLDIDPSPHGPLRG